jgi:hypothetical protein
MIRKIGWFILLLPIQGFAQNSPAFLNPQNTTALGKRHGNQWRRSVLSAKMDAQFIKGPQGNHPKYQKTIATEKHYVMHSGHESKRHTSDTDVSEHDLPETSSSADDLKEITLVVDQVWSFIPTQKVITTGFNRITSAP